MIMKTVANARKRVLNWLNGKAGIGERTADLRLHKRIIESIVQGRQVLRKQRNFVNVASALCKKSV